ncbi:hypothetical protein JKY72_02690 [Candidatus Gracilibacteria bacterium]|nr:hypothetical protein [Candidatus Gracilibacteria bacterium]
METSIFIAQVVGVTYLALGLGMLMDQAYYKKALDDMMNCPSFILLAGMMALIIGFLIVNVHNFWVRDWTVLVTIIGWGSLIKGVLLLLAPKKFTAFSKNIMKNLHTQAIFVVIMGGVFTYFGFFM